RSIESKDLMLELARAAKTGDPSKLYAVQTQMRVELNKAELAPIHEPEQALRLSSVSALPPNKPPPPKPPVLSGEPAEAGGAGWGRGDGKPLLLVMDQRDTIRFKARADGRHSVEYGRADSIEVFGRDSLLHEDAVDLAVIEAARRARNGEPVVIEFDRM